MSKLVIMGTIEVAPGKRDQLVPLLAAHGARCLKDEPSTRSNSRSWSPVTAVQGC